MTMTNLSNGPSDLHSYDWIVVSTSAGKDSQAMLSALHARLQAENVPHERVVVVHADLGRAEWVGTRELAERQVAAYGYRFEVVKRPQGDLLDHVQDRYAKLVDQGRGDKPAWYSSAARYCTSDHKRSQIWKLFTRLAKETRQATGRKQARILDCVGMRAAESAARAKKDPFKFHKAASNGRRHVDQWLPIHAWTDAQVWQEIERSGLPYHRAYDLGMQRLSCVFCVMATENDLMIAGEHNPELLQSYVDVEQKVGSSFQQHRSLASVQARLQAGERGTVDAQPARYGKRLALAGQTPCSGGF